MRIVQAKFKKLLSSILCNEILLAAGLAIDIFDFGSAHFFYHNHESIVHVTMP